MRTWVRRVRLWLGVLLLAVGVVVGTMGMFVSAEARWSRHLPIDAAGIRAREWAGYEDQRNSWHLALILTSGWIWLDADYQLTPFTPSVQPAETVRSFSWWYRPIQGERFVNLRLYSEVRIKEWREWFIAAFGWRLYEYQTRYPAGQDFATSQRQKLDVMIPFYLPLLLGLALCFSPLRAVIVKRRRGRRGECLACGYDRRSLAADQPCPECGAGRTKGPNSK